MASEIGPAAAGVNGGDTTVGERLFQEPYAFQFFQAVRVLERMFRDRVPVGLHEHPRHEVARFRSHISLTFPPSEIAAITPGTAGEGGAPAPVPGQAESKGEAADALPHLTVNFMGLAGPLGVLPLHHTALLADPAAAADTIALRDFLDLFNHRFISFFYRAWEKYRPPIAFERGADDLFSECLFCLIGLGSESERERLTVDERALLFYAGLLAQHPRSAVALEGVLRDYFQVPVVVCQFQGQWFHANAETLTRIGAAGQNHRLGVDSVLWQRVWDPHARFRVRLGPLSYREFQDFLPTGDGYGRLVEMVRLFVGDEFSFDVQPVLRAGEIPSASVGRDRTLRLGWSMWLKTRPRARDADEAVFTARVAS